MQFREKEGRDPDVVVVTNAGGGNLTGTARGLLKAGANTQVVGASVSLEGLHMASDTQFNKKNPLPQAILDLGFHLQLGQIGQTFLDLQQDL